MNASHGQPDSAGSAGPSGDLSGLLADWRTGGGLAGLASVLGPEEAALEDASPLRASDAGAEALAAGERTFFGRKLPLSGRRDALERLYNAVRDTVAERKARVVSIVGPPGLGKTRLLAETLAIIDPATKGIDVLAVAADATDGPQALVAKLVRARFGLGVHEKDTVAYERILDAALPLLGPTADRQLASTARMLGFLAGLRAMGPSADALPADLEHFRRQSMKTLVGIFRKDLERAPRILVVKRANELRDHAVELVRDLVDELRETPFVVIAMAETAPETLAPSGVEQVVVPVEPLSDRDVERLVQALLDDVAVEAGGPDVDELVRRLVAHAHGSPRLVEENLHLLVQRGALVPGPDGALTLMARWADGELAEELETASRLRMLALHPGQRALLQAAAIFGRVFSVDGVIAVAEALDRGFLERLGAAASVVLPFGGGGLLPGLAALDQAGVIARVEGDAGGAWRFRHGSDRGRLLSELAPPARAQAHRVAAAWLRTHGGAPHEVIAGHELDGAHPSEAATALVLAAESAQLELAVARAKGLYRRALHVLGLDEPNRGLDRAPLLLRVLSGFAELAVRTGDYGYAKALFWGVLEAARVAGDGAQGAQGWLGLGKAYRGLGDYARARAALGLASDLFRARNDSRGLGATLDQLARVHWLEGGDGGTEQARALFEAALAIRRRMGLPGAIAETVGMIANIRIQHADFQGAEELLEEARDRWHEAGDLSGEARSLVALGALAFARGDRLLAVDRWRDGLGRAEQAGDRDLIGVFLNNIGEAQLELGDFPRAAAALVEAREITSETSDLRTLADVLKNLAVLAAVIGDFDRADTLVVETLRLAEALRSRPAQAQALRAQAICKSHRAAAHRLHPDAAAWVAEATHLYNECLTTFEALGDKWEADRTRTMRQNHLTRHPPV